MSFNADEMGKLANEYCRHRIMKRIRERATEGALYATFEEFATVEPFAFLHDLGFSVHSEEIKSNKTGEVFGVKVTVKWQIK